MPSLASRAYDHSTYVMPPSLELTPSVTPADFSLPSPLPVHFLPGSAVHTDGAALFSHLVKFSVVPDSSERKKTLIGLAGRATPGLTFFSAASSHEVIWPEKILAATSGVTVRLSTPESL